MSLPTVCIKRSKNCVCIHTHLKSCDQCDSFTTAIDKILEAVNSCQHADKNVLLQDIQCSERQISEWKSHILRTVNQDEACHEIQEFRRIVYS